MKKVILFSLIVIIILGIVSIIYLSKAVLPSKIKTELIKTLEDRLERKIELQEIKFNLFKGIQLENLVIYDNPKYSKNPLLNIKRASGNISLLSIILQRKFIVTSININTAELQMIRLGKNLWNFSDLIKQKSKDDRKGFPFIIYKINVLNTKVFFEDRTLSPLLSETIEDLNLKINLSLDLDVKFNLEAKIKNKERHCQLYSDGIYSIKNEKLSAQIKIKDLLLSEYYPYFKTGPLQIKGGKLQDSDLNLVLENRKLQILAKAKIGNLDLQRDRIELLGALNIDANFNYDPDSKDQLSLSGDINITDGLLKGIPRLSTIRNITGTIAFDKNKIQTSDLSGISFGCPLKFSGTLENLKNPSINLNINSDIRLSNIIDIIPEKIKSNFSEIAGNTKLELDIQGYLRNVKTFDYTGKAKISDSLIKLTHLPEKLSNINADITFDKNGVTWQNLSCVYKNINLIANGSMSGFTNPTIETDLKSDAFDLKTKVSVNKNNIGISKLKGTYLNSNFDIAGNLDITDKENPSFNLSLSSDLELGDLKDTLPKFQENLKKANLAGLFTIKGNLGGVSRDWENWRVNFKGSSSGISLFGFKLKDIRVNYIQAQNMIKDFNVKSTAYDGPLLINGTMSLSENFPYLLNINLSSLDLSKLKLDTSLKEKPIGGVLSTQIQINGRALELSSMTGGGKLEVTDGNLWQLNLLKGLGELLFIPEFDKIVFNAARGDFTIENEIIHTDNLKFMSNELNLSCEGNIDFERNLELLITTQFSNELINSSEDLRKVITSAIGQASQIVSVKLSGTLEKPKYSIIFKPVDILKKVLKGFGLDAL